MKSEAWLLLLYGLPTKHSTQRVSLWRKLRKFGALQLKTSAYVLPDQPAHFERFQWLAKQVRDDGGDATLIRVTEIEGLSNEQLAQMFNDARARDFAELGRAVAAFLKRKRGKRADTSGDALEKLQQRFREIREIDYFDSPAAHDAQMLLNRAAGSQPAGAPSGPKLDAKKFAGKAWLTRPRPEIDRVGSAWLIRKFIDPKARFVFGASPAVHREAIPYDMHDVEFTHQGEDCTFETLLRRFGLRDRAAQQMGEMIHDADLEDGKFQRPEAFGLDRVFKGWARLGLADAEILAKGFECFDALYAECQRRAASTAKA
ncbi:MAG: chromate resistance protein [Verrucomicrobia bacterium]|nr:chromate resistance protein [Verrucomicrobiota bacterium]